MGAGASAAMQVMLRAILAYLLRYFLNHAGEVVDSVLGRNGKSMRWMLEDFAEKAKNDAALLTELKPHVYAVVTGVAEDRLQVKLDPSDPFSPASLTAAISGKVGIPMTNIMDKEVLKSDVLRYGAGIAAAKTGLHLDPTDPFGKASITAAIASASGVPLTDITNKEQIRADLMAFGKAQMAAEIAEKANGKLANMVAGKPREAMNAIVDSINTQRAYEGLKPLAADQVKERMRIVDVVVRSAANEEIASYEKKVCLWNKELAKRGAQVMASRRYRERMKQSGFSKKWTRGGVIKGE